MKQILALILSVTLYANSMEQEVKRIEDNFCKELTSEQKFCMEYKVEYPIVSGGDMQVINNINNAIKNMIPTSLNAQKYVTDILKDNNGEIFSSEHSDETKIKLLSVTESTFTLDVSNSNFTGGAHGMYGSKASNYDKFSGKLIVLDDMFLPHYEESLRAISEQVYREQNGLIPNDDLRETQNWFDNKFVLPESIGLGIDGLHLDYMPYEIKAYAFGTTSFVVPYYLLASIAKPNSYLTPLIKSSTLLSNSGNVERKFEQEYEATIDFKAKLLPDHKVQIDGDITNLTDYHIGGLSLSFPQLMHQDILVQKEQRGFSKIQLYPVGSRLYYAPTKTTIKSKYILIEADTKSWYKNQTKSISLLLNIPQHIDELYVNVRATFREGGDIIAIPYSGAEDQQGFYNYHIKVQISKND